MEKNGFAAVICEYNPFHTGHERQLAAIKNDFDGIVCIMSGGFVQRGDVAIADKYLRAKAAVMCGASAVFELPVPFSNSAAPDFAKAGVSLACSLGIKNLCFSAEDSQQPLTEIATLAESDEFNGLVGDILNSEKNCSYPVAFQKALREQMGAGYAAMIKKRNNILAVEYMRAAGGNIECFAYPRFTDCLSATELRGYSARQMLSMLPEKSREVFEPQVEADRIRQINALNAFIIGTIRKNGVSADTYGADKEMASAIEKAAKEFSDIHEVFAFCTNKTRTSAAVRRAVLASALGITDKQVHEKPLYALLLAADETGRRFISNARPQIPIITKPAHIMRTNEDAIKQFMFSASADSIAALASPNPESFDPFEKTPYILK